MPSQRAITFGGEVEADCECQCHDVADASQELLAACEELFGDIGYVCDRDGCECGEFVEQGACCHTRAMAVIAKAKGQG